MSGGYCHGERFARVKLIGGIIAWTEAEETAMRNATLLMLALGLAAQSTQAEETITIKLPAKPPALAGGRCLDPVQARGWTVLDDKHILIDGGRYQYSVEFSYACRDLDFNNALGFRGDPVTGRVCGTLGDEVVTRDFHCRIQQMEIISKEDYRQQVKDHAAQVATEREARRIARDKDKKSKSP